MKTCFKCKINKPYECFYKHGQMADGYLNKCKECAKKDTSDNRSKNIKYYRDYEKSRASLPHRIEMRNAYVATKKGKIAAAKAKKIWAASNRKKKKASSIVNNAIRSGAITKSNQCQLCGDNESRIEGHHYDYDEPLLVTWLCSSCHRWWHAAHGQPANSKEIQNTAQQTIK